LATIQPSCWGRSVETLIPDRFRRNHPLDRAEYLANPHHARRMAGAVEVRALRKDGTEFPVEISLSPVEGDPGGAVTWAIRDVTERKRVEEAIRQSEEKFRKIFNGSIDAIAVNSLADAKYLDINEGYLKLIGYSREEVLGRTPKELKIWANHAERARASKELRTKGFIHNFEGEFLTKDGTRRSGLFSAVVVDLPEQPCAISFVRDITERRQAEMAIRRLAAIVESSEDAIASSTLDGTITSWNRGAERLFGYSASEIVGQSTASFVGPDAWPEFQQTLERIGQQGGIHRYDARRLKKDGSPVDITVTLSPIYDAAGAVVGVSAIGKDITERKQSERELRQSEEHFREIFDASTEVISINSSADGRYINVNGEFERMTGYAREEAIGRTPRELKLWASVHDLATVMRELRTKGFIRNFESDLFTKSGARRSRLLSAVLINFAEQRCILSFSRDITERKRAEETRALLAAIIRSADDPILSSDLNWIVTSWNPGAQRLYGYSAAEIIGQKVDIMVPPDHMAEVEHARMKILRGEKLVPYESKRIRKDGSVIDISVTLSPIYDATGSLVGISAIHRDITERRLAERAKELARSNAELEEFAHIVSHDLREPLHNVTSYVGLLAKDYQGKLGADADEYIRYALDGVAWMLTLIEDLRAYSRATVEKKELEPADFGSVVNRAITNLATAVEEQKATVTYEPMPTVAADERAITQVFQNLIENGLKFHGQEPPRVHVGVKRITGGWAFFVRDNGIGIDPEHAHKIFTIFHRLHSRSEYPGSGIGLAICKKIVERHGGRIWVESEPCHGATFYFTVPA
jgi:PAS domain S-box-containing protein